MTMKYRVYRNLNNGKLSIKCCNTGLVVGYCDYVGMKNCKFIVGKLGQQRVVETGQKNVHAFIEGLITRYSGFVSRENRGYPHTYQEVCIECLPEFASYNPYKHPYFFRISDELSIDKADKVEVSCTGLITIWRNK